jgi:hypothetical protein
MLRARVAMFSKEKYRTPGKLDLQINSRVLIKRQSCAIFGTQLYENIFVTFVVEG